MSHAPIDLVRQAKAALARGWVADAEGLCRRALDADPGLTEAKLVLGLLAAKRGDAPAGIQLFREVLAADPGNFDAANGAGFLERLSGNVLEAMEFSRLAIRLRPDDPSAHLNLGRCHLDQKRPQEALASFEQAVKVNPRYAQGHADRGLALQMLGKPGDAAGAYRAAIAADSRLIGAYIGLGQLLLAHGDPQEAVVCFKRAYALSPNSAPASVLLARALIEEGHFGEAEESLHRAISMDPKLAEAHALLGRLLQQQGRFDEAAPVLERALAFDPERAATYFTVVQGKKMTDADRPMAEKMIALANRDDLLPDHKRLLRYALGKAFEDLGDYAAAMEHFDEANRLAQMRLDGAGRVFDLDRHRAEIDATIAAFAPAFFLAHSQVGCLSDAPVFIVGMARSGTTLLEQMLSSHPRVGAAGELGYWLNNGWSLAPKADGSIDAELAERMGAAYVELLAKAAPRRRLVTDKNPKNFMALGPIRLALPNARIIHCRRSPIDTCLSIYTTSFNAGPDFAHRRSNIVFAYREYRRLMEHWRRTLPSDRFMEVDYERLVADRESTVRDIVSFLGLDWSDACLRHESNEHAISTPSLWQARQPVYQSSVERWRRYEPWLGEFRALLEDPGP